MRGAAAADFNAASTADLVFAGGGTGALSFLTVAAGRGRGVGLTAGPVGFGRAMVVAEVTACTASAEPRLVGSTANALAAAVWTSSMILRPVGGSVSVIEIAADPCPFRGSE